MNRRRRMLRMTVLSFAVTLWGLAVVGCGSSATYEDVLRGLKSAALSKASYEAVTHTDDLERSQKALINALCRVTEQFSVGDEPGDEQFFDDVEKEATEELGIGSLPSSLNPVTAPLNRLRALYNQSQYSSGAASYFAKGCIR